MSNHVMNHPVERVNPDELSKNPAYSQAVVTAYSQAVVTQGTGKTIYIGGQNAVNQKHEILGKGNIETQTEKALQNVQAVLKACGATFNDVVKLNVHIVQGNDIAKGFAAAQRVMGKDVNPPAITVLVVQALGHPDFLIEVDAIAFIPE